MFRRRLKRLSLSLLIALGLVLGLLLVLPALLKPSLNRWLPQVLGSADNPAIVEIDRLSWSGMKLSALALTLADGTDIELENLTVRYRLADLLQARLDSVELDRLSLRLAEADLKEVASEAADDAREVASQHLNEYVEIPAIEQLLKLPLERLRIHQFDFSQSDLSSTVQVRVDDQLLRVNGELTLTEVAQPWQLELQLQPNGRWFMMLSDQAQLLAQQHGRIRQDASNTYVELNQRVDLAALSERFSALAAIPLPLQQLRLQADLTLPNQGTLPADASLTLNTWLVTDAGKLLSQYPWQASTWALAVNKNSAADDWRFSLASGAQSIEVQSPELAQTVHYKGHQQGQARCQADLSQCQAKVYINAQLLDALTATTALAQVDMQPQMQWSLSEGLQLELPLQSHAQVSALAPDVPIQNIQLVGELNATLVNNRWQLQSEEGFALTIPEQPIEGWWQETIRLSVLSGLRLQGDLDSEHLRQQFAAQPLNIKTEPFQLSQAANQSELNVAASDLSCRPYVAMNAFSATCSVQINTTKSNIEGWPVPPLSVVGDLLVSQRPSGRQIDSELHLSAADELHTRFKIQHNLGSQTGNLQWHLDDLKLNWSDLDMTEMLALTKVDLLAGSVAGQGWVDWQQQDDGWLVSPDLNLRIDGFSGIYDNSLVFDDWNGLFALRRPFMGNYLVDAQVSGKSLNPGVELSNVLARTQTEVAADLSWALADIYEVRTDLLGGSVSTPFVRYDTRKSTNRFHVELNRVQLSQLAALEPAADIQATGVLDGLLPIHLTPAGPQVPAGSLFARDPGGQVQYNNPTADALAQSGQGMDLAMQLLSDFNYNKLQVGVAYEPSGLSTLDLEFQGKNPDFFNGKASHLNVNLQYNLIDLLESLRLADDLISKIEQRYQ